MSNVQNQARAVRVAVTMMLSALAVMGCSDSTYCSQDITYEGNLIRLASVVDAQTGAPLYPVVMTNFSIDGAAVPISAIAPAPGANLTITNDTLVCSGVCAFGVLPGDYSFSVARPGRSDTTITVNAQYTSYEKGCLHRYRGGMDLNLSL